MTREESLSLTFEDKMDQIQAKYQNLLDKVNSCKNASDAEYINLNKKISELEPIVNSVAEYKKIDQQIKELLDLIDSETDKEFVTFAIQEEKVLQNRKAQIKQEIRILLLPKIQEDSKNAIIEIRSGAGGAEAGLFAQELFMMYQKYCMQNKWKFEILSIKNFEGGGIREASALVNGKDVFTKLKFESGVHRVQRVPKTESSGRIHTSTATVAILAEANQHDIDLQDKDLKIETCRSSGAGGQHVDTTDSAVKITHLPTGITVVQQGKSQHRNKANGLSILRSRILNFKIEQEHKHRDNVRKMQIGSGDRSEKTRTYNFPQGRITDHRINFTVHNINKIVFEGDLFEITNALQIENKTRMLEELGL